MAELNPYLKIQREKILHERFMYSYYLQFKCISELGDDVSSILEIGPGAGYCASFARGLNYDYTTIDIDERVDPDILADFNTDPIDGSWDLVCAFEMLEHSPYERFRPNLEKMKSLSKRFIFISLPYEGHHFYLRFELPKFSLPKFLNRFRGQHAIQWFSEWPLTKDKEINLEGKKHWQPHYWELGRKSHPKSRVLSDIKKAGLKINWAFHNPLHQGHYFIMMEKSDL